VPAGPHSTLARGFDVIATDPAPSAEANLRKYVDDAWAVLTSIGLSPGASRDRLEFTTDMKKALANADFVQENGPERVDFKIQALHRHGRGDAAGFAHRVELLVANHECRSVKVCPSRTVCHRASVQSPPRHSARGSRGRRKDIAGKPSMQRWRSISLSVSGQFSCARRSPGTLRTDSSRLCIGKCCI